MTLSLSAGNRIWKGISIIVSPGPWIQSFLLRQLPQPWFNTRSHIYKCHWRLANKITTQRTVSASIKPLRLTEIWLCQAYLLASPNFVGEGFYWCPLWWGTLYINNACRISHLTKTNCPLHSVSFNLKTRGSQLRLSSANSDCVCICELVCNLFRCERSSGSLLNFSCYSYPVISALQIDTWKALGRIQCNVFRHCASFSHTIPPLLLSDLQTSAIPVSGISWGEVVSCDELCIHFVTGASNR